MRQTPPDAAPADELGPGIRIQPPLIYAASILAGIGLDRLWPLGMPFGLHGPVFAGTLLALVLLLAGLCIREFHRSGTEVRADRPDTALITSGPYRYTRNPYFVAYLLMLTAYTLLLQSRTLLILSLAGALVVHRMVLTEEHYLEATHGDRYRQYRARVPRYLLFL